MNPDEQKIGPGEGVTQPIDNEPLFDLSILNSIDRKDNGLIKQITSIFIESMTTNMADLKEAMELKKIDQVRRIAHKMKPSIDLFGIHILFDVIRELESARDIDGVTDAKVASVENIMHTVVGQLQRYV